MAHPAGRNPLENPLRSLPPRSKWLVVNEKRSEPRKIVLARAEVRWQDDTGIARVSAGMLEDTSPRGACIVVREPIVPGTSVRVVRRSEDFTGVVRNCNYDGSGYLLGILRDPRRDAEN